MNPKPMLYVAKPDRSAGEIPEIKTSGLTMVVCAVLVATCFAAPLVLTLPQALDAAASPMPGLAETVAAAGSEATFHERHPAQPGTDWVDTLDESSLAQWRMRASD